MQFYKLAFGARFDFRGKRYEKTAMSMTTDEDGLGAIFMGETEVDPIGKPLLLPEAEAERWRPSDVPWWANLSPAPGQR